MSAASPYRIAGSCPAEVESAAPRKAPRPVALESEPEIEPVACAYLVPSEPEPLPLRDLLTPLLVGSGLGALLIVGFLVFNWLCATLR